jgi:hypothetical protein
MFTVMVLVVPSVLVTVKMSLWMEPATNASCAELAV